MDNSDIRATALGIADKKSGTYLDRITGEYILIFGGRKVGAYLDTGDEEHNAQIDRMMWDDFFKRVQQK